MLKISGLITTICLITVFIFTGCYKDRMVTDSAAISAVTKEISFASDILPIFNSSCSLSGCHNSVGHVPDLSAPKAYTSLLNGYVLPENPESSPLYQWMKGYKSTPMPVSGVNNSYCGLVLAWIKQGAKNN
jgi:hypothetical protein